MQKISSYLYPNRISVIANLAPYTTEWRIVYQRTVKLYQGLDNTIEFDFKNAQQRRIDISNYQIQIIILDELKREIFTGSIIPNTVKGIGTVTIPAYVFTNMAPQFLTYSLYIVNNNGTKTPIYGDTQFGAIGKIDLLDGVMPVGAPPRIIDTFIYLVDDTNPSRLVKKYTSESVEVNPLNDWNENSKIDLEFRLTNLKAEITVQISDDAVVSAGTIWRDIEVFSVEPSTERIYKTYNEVTDYSNNIGWLRVKYIPTQDNTGKIDKIIVKL